MTWVRLPSSSLLRILLTLDLAAERLIVSCAAILVFPHAFTINARILVVSGIGTQSAVIGIKARRGVDIKC